MRWFQKIDSQHAANFRRDIGTILLSILTAVLLVETGAIHQLVKAFDGWQLVSSFLAGFFFSSMFTTAPAIAILGDLSRTYPIWMVALVGAFGSVIADSVIYRFVRDDLDQDILYIFNLTPHRRLRHIFKTRIFHWLPPLLAGLIIASPLPDELAMAVLGLAKVNKKLFALISFVFSFLGIMAIGLIARAI